MSAKPYYCMFFLAVLPHLIFCQTDSAKEWYSPDLYKGPYVWLTFGLGKAPQLFKENKGGSGGLIPTVQIGKNVFSLRALGNAENPIPVASSYYGYDEYLGEIGFLYGRCYKSESLFASLSAGIGRVRGMHRGEFLGCPVMESCVWEKLHYDTMGLALESQLFLQAPILGFGVYLFGNINPEQSYGGFLVSFQLGYTKRFLRRKEQP